jgi:hypothetical protein
MSSLILPKTQMNPVLEANLQILFARYPHEKARLEPILRAPFKEPALPNDLQLPPAPSKPPIRILLYLGIKHPQFLATILNDPSVRVENFKLIIVENDANFLAFAFQTCDLTQILRLMKTEWLLCHNEDSIKPVLFNLLNNESVTSMMENVQTLEVGEPDENQPFYSKVPTIYAETIDHVLTNHGHTADSLLGLEVTLRNKKYLTDHPGIHDLKNAFKGASALVVGAGPSLDAEIETIKKYNDRFVVIAVDAALKPLVKAGIRVDYVTSIERLNEYQKPFFQDLPETSAELVAFPVVHPEVLDMFPGKVRMVYRIYSFYAYFEKAFPKGILKIGSSAAHLAIRLADHMGCRRAFFIGTDCCYEEKDGKYRSHCSDTGYPEWSEYLELSEFQSKRKHREPMKALNNLGGEAVTNVTYYNWMKEYAQELAVLGQRMTMVNCAGKGLRVPGIPYKSLEEAATNLDPLTIEKPAVPQFIERARKWDNSDLLKNVIAWKQMALDAKADAEELLQMETIPVERYHALYYVYGFRFMRDDMFISFVVQICSRRFFQLENQFWANSLNFDVDVKEKISVIAEYFRMFIEVLEEIERMINASDGKEND